MLSVEEIRRLQAENQPTPEELARYLTKRAIELEQAGHEEKAKQVCAMLMHVVN